MSASQLRLLPWVALSTIYVVWGSTYLAIKLVVAEMPPFASAGLRFTVAGIVMAAIAALREGRHGWPSRRQFLDSALVGFLLLAVGNGLVMWSETRIPSGLAALIVATVPLWMMLLDGLRPRGQAWSVRGFVAVAIGLGGVAVIVRPEAGIGAHELPGVLGLLAASFSWSVGALYAQSVPKRLPVLTASAVQMMAGGMALFIVSAVVGEPLGAFADSSARAWLSIGYLGVFGSLLGYTAFAYCLSELPASTVGTYAYVNPVVAVALGSLVLSEPLPPALLAGGTLIVVAVVLTTLARRTSGVRSAVGDLREQRA